MEWPDLDSQDVRFWKYQWDKHGKCVSNLRGIMTNCLDYFHKTMEIASRLNAKIDKLLDFRLFPDGFPNNSVETQINYVSILRNLRDLHFSDAPFRPRKIIAHWHQVGDQYWISSVNFCFNLDLQPIDCNFRYQGTPQYVPRYVLLFWPRKSRNLD